MFARSHFMIRFLYWGSLNGPRILAVAESEENPANCLHDHGNVVFSRLVFLYLKSITCGVEPRAAFVHTCHGGRVDARLDGVVYAAEQSLVASVA